MDAADSLQVFLHDDVLDVGAVGATLAQGALATCSCAIAAMLFNHGIISANTARRLRNASVLYSYSTLIASPLVVELAGLLAGPALQFIQATVIPYGVTAGFVVVNLVVNQIYVFDDVKYVPVVLQPSLVLPFKGQAKFYSIVKRPERPAVAIKRLVHAAQREVARVNALKPKVQETLALSCTIKDEKDGDLLTPTSICMTLLFVAASSYARSHEYARSQAQKASSPAMPPSQKVSEVHQVSQQLPSTNRAIFKTPVPKYLPLLSGAQLITNTEHTVQLFPASKIPPRARVVIAATALIALQWYHCQQSHEGWLSGGDVDEE